jgi:hypothetical protein
MCLSPSHWSLLLWVSHCLITSSVCLHRDYLLFSLVRLVLGHLSVWKVSFLGMISLWGSTLCLGVLGAYTACVPQRYALVPFSLFPVLSSLSMPIWCWFPSLDLVHSVKGCASVQRTKSVTTGPQVRGESLSVYHNLFLLYSRPGSLHGLSGLSAGPCTG